MSKLRTTIFQIIASAGLILQFFNISAAQEKIEAVLKIESLSPPLVSIKGKFSGQRTADAGNFSFWASHAGVENLAARISGLELKDTDGQIVSSKRLADGEFLAEREFVSWSYRVRIEAPFDLSALAHISWLSGDRGFLMTGDLLPQLPEKIPARLTFELPPGWRLATGEKETGSGTFETEDAENAVFFIGQNLREKKIPVEGAALNFVITDQWQVEDEEMFKMAGEILARYQKLFEGSPTEKAQIFLVKFPNETRIGRWEAETRGANITILSAEMPFKTQSVQRLHEQLRHELFHLWFPNGVNLSGNYDWFYEGFALYQSLRTAVAANRIRFEDFLETLSRAFDIDTLQSQRVSLIEASKNRWNGSNTQVYARGMLTAFLIDTAMLQRSKGKNSLTDILREIYQAHRLPNPPEEGNIAILKILGSRSELRPIIEKYIRGTENIDWQTGLERFGIESKTENFMTKLTVKAKLDGRQKDLLDKLGYNNWRKNSP